MIWFCLFQFLIMVLFFVALNNMVNAAIVESVEKTVVALIREMGLVFTEIKADEQSEEHF